MKELRESIELSFLENYTLFHRHRRNSEGVMTSEEIRIGDLPRVKFPEGVRLPEKKDGKMPESFDLPILTDFQSMKNCESTWPIEFLDDVDVFTTLSALRSLICQWTDFFSTKSVFFKKNAHFCQIDQKGRLFINTSTNYTVPFEKSTSFLNRFTILEHGQTWQEFVETSYSGVGKMRLTDGICIGFTFKMYARFENQPVDIIVRSASSFQKEIEFHFLNAFLTRKKLWRYDISRNRSNFQEELDAPALWLRMPRGKQLRLLDAFSRRLPDFLCHVANRIATGGLYKTSSLLRKLQKMESDQDLML